MRVVDAFHIFWLKSLCFIIFETGFDVMKNVFDIYATRPVVLHIHPNAF